MARVTQVGHTVLTAPGQQWCCGASQCIPEHPSPSFSSVLFSHCRAALSPIGTQGALRASTMHWPHSVVPLWSWISFHTERGRSLLDEFPAMEHKVDHHGDSQSMAKAKGDGESPPVYA